MNYSGDDYTFRLSGVTVDMVNIGSGEYRAKIEGGFSRVKKLTAGDGQPYWEATDKKGNRYLFGQTAASRQVDPANAGRIFKWNLDRVEDPNGNYLTVAYTTDQGQVYLDHIDYTGNTNGTPTTNMVKFYLETRSDVSDLYSTNFRVKTASRLKTIDVLAGGVRVRAYKLSYTTSTTTGRSILSSLQQFGKDATLDGSGTITGGLSLPAVSFTWPEAASTYDNMLNVNTSYGMAGAGAWASDKHVLALGDFNGDGRTDILLQAKTNANTTLLLLADGTGGFQTVQNIDTAYGMTPGDWASDRRKLALGDFNGDGCADLLLQGTSGGTYSSYLLLANCTGGFQTKQLINTSYGMGGPGDWAADRRKLAVGDFNGDGSMDLLLQLASGVYSGSYLLLADGNGGFQQRQVIDALWGMGGDGDWRADRRKLTIGDFNGDGSIDLLLQGTSGGTYSSYLIIADGTGGFQQKQVIDSLWGMTGAGDWASDRRKLAVGDFNGDGRTDLLLQVASGTYSGSYLLIADGNGGFQPRQVIDTLWGMGGDGDWRADRRKLAVGDVSGDGKSDLLLQGTSGGTYSSYLLLADGNGGFQSKQVIDNSWGMTGAGDWASDRRNLALGDFSGDGKNDILLQGTSTYSTFSLTANITPANLMTVIANGLGDSTTMTYKPSTQYTNTQLPFPVQTVSAITTNDGNGNNASTTSAYAGGYYHIGERDLRGFRCAQTTGPVGPNGEQTITETWFHQGNTVTVEDYVACLSPPSTDRQTLKVADGYMKGKPYRARVSDGQSHLYSETTTSYAADTDGAPFFTPPLQVDACTWDGTGSCGKSTRTVYTFDSYGNATREDQSGDLSDTSDDRTITRTFSSNTTAWIVGLPLTETIYQGIGTTNQVASTSFYYDSVTDCSTASTNQNPTQGNLTRVTRWLSGGTDPETRMAYNVYGNLTCTRDPNGNTTTITSYDGTNTFPKVVTNALNQQTSTVYYGVDGQPMDNGLYGQVKSVTDPNPATITTTYDVFGRKSVVTFPDTGTASFFYNSFGTVGTQNVQTNTAIGLSTWTYFDGLGRTITAKSTGPDTKTIATQTQYNVRGAVLKTSLPYFVPGTPAYQTFVYDPVGRVTQVTNPDSSRILSCTANWITVTIDPNNHRRRETRDAYSRLAKVEEYTGTIGTCDTSVGTPYATTTYQYHVRGDLLTVTDAQNNQSTMSYDTLSRKYSMHDPDMGTWNYVYGPAGNLTQQTDNKSQSIYFRYDALNRRAQKDYGTQKPLGTGDVRYTYDGATSYGIGRLTQVQDQSGKTTFFYDSMGRITKTSKCVDDPYACTNGITYTTQTAYDPGGRVFTLNYPDNPSAVFLTYEYNGPFLNRVYDTATTYAQYAGYNALGQPGTLTYGNGVVTTYTYSNSGNSTCPLQNFRLCTMVTTKSPTTLQNLGYTYDAGGNVMSVTDSINGTQNYTYDELDRLKTGPPGTYYYDQIGNLTSNPQVGSYAYPASGPTSVRPHAVCATGSTTCGSGTQYAYDNNGNLLTGAGRTFVWDYENRPTNITSGGTTTTMVYDGDGGRVKKLWGSDFTHYIGKLYECDTIGGYQKCVKFIFAGSQRIAAKQVNTGVVDYYHPDHLGSSSVITAGASGAQEEAITYYPWGATASNTSSTTPPTDVVHKYTSQELDGTSGLYFYQARYYDATLGRFVSADTIVPSAGDPQTLNRYTYAGNNSIRYVDPSGHFFGIDDLVAVVIVGAVLGGAASGVQSHWGPKSVFLGAAIGAFAAGIGAGEGVAVSGVFTSGALGFSSASLGAVIGGAVGGATAGLTSAGLYRAAGYDADIGLAVGAGAAGGLVGGAVQVETGVPVLGGAAGGATASLVAGGDPGKGAIEGAAAAIVAGFVEGQRSTGQTVTGDPNQFEANTAIGVRPNTFLNRVWTFLIGDPYSHVFLSHGNGTFSDATFGQLSGDFDYTSNRFKSLVGREYIKADLDLDLSGRGAFAGRSYGFGPGQSVCTTYTCSVTGGRLWGLGPGQQIWNTLGYRPGYLYYNLSIYGQK